MNDVMKKTYFRPTTAQVCIDGSELLIDVSTGTEVNLTVDDNSDGDASEALVKPFEQQEWDW